MEKFACVPAAGGIGQNTAKMGTRTLEAGHELINRGLLAQNATSKTADALIKDNQRVMAGEI
jgi:hypothetical protein